jgi:cytochrome c551/c552
MKKNAIIGGLMLIVFGLACGGSGNADAPTAATTTTPVEEVKSDDRGIGKFTKVEVAPSLDVPMAEAGTKVYDMKCASCHKLTSEKLVGPGWQGVTSRRKPEWVMNFVTNTEEMLNKDAEAQAQLELCLVRMPNQNLTDADARSVYEFMRKNDGVK